MTILKLTQDFLYKEDIDYDKVLVVCATKQKCYKDTILYQSLLDQRYSGYVIFHENNTQGLCRIYNQYIDNKWDCVIYVHDDVYIDSCNFVKKIYDGFKKFDVCGLAGGSNLIINQPLLWHLMTTRSSHTGVVSHPYNNSYIPTVFGEIGKEVILLDGLFLAVQPKILLEKNVRFDVNITGFHHYDLKFCIDCHIASLKMGTIPVHVIHSSPGLKEYTDDFNKSQDYLREYLNKLYDKKR